ncbi:unnamed protein product [Mytilus coruscus]|uniref:N-acetyltransferase domain-containing protein n=1 Tax=Mytilus coruscus TaxID=42192 RepID=A0A6J8AWF7_MYTCO|nr:unnamed protein product [Mytilus coruscus]
MAGLFSKKNIFHRVTLDDYDKVMTIRNQEDVFDGRDRLPYQFHRIIGSTNTLAFAALLEDQFIAFSLAYVIDDGKTFVSKSSRVAKKHEGKGVMTWLLKEMAFIEFYINRRNLVTSKENISRDTISEIELLDRQKLEDLLTLPQTSACLFQGCRVVIDLVPYRPIQTNVAYMIQTTTSMIGSYLDDANSALISFGDYSEVFRGLLYYIDVYGNVMANIEAHIQYHMEQIKNIQSKSDNIVIQIYCEKHANIDLVVNTMRKFGFGLEENNPQYCLCVERNIR